jgi:DNA-binding NtrC family response regulator
MTLRMQGMLLRFLETGELQKVGTERSGTVVDVRVVAATNRRLEDMVADGGFREDLFYRLNVVHMIVPPLRDRRSDVPLLVESVLKQYENLEDYTVRAFDPEAMQALCEYAWPGNVRELQNIVERAVVTGRHDVARLEDLPAEIRAGRGLSRTRKERRRTIADDLYKRVVEGHESFWTAVYPLYMNREITKSNVRDLVGKGLQEARGNYKIVARLFNMEAGEYKKFLNFLRKHDCQVPFREYR